MTLTSGQMYALLAYANDADGLNVSDEEIREGHHRTEVYAEVARRAWAFGCARRLPRCGWLSISGTAPVRTASAVAASAATAAKARNAVAGHARVPRTEEPPMTKLPDVPEPERNLENLLFDLIAESYYDGKAGRGEPSDETNDIRNEILARWPNMPGGGR